MPDILHETNGKSGQKHNIYRLYWVAISEYTFRCFVRICRWMRAQIIRWLGPKSKWCAHLPELIIQYMLLWLSASQSLPQSLPAIGKLSPCWGQSRYRSTLDCLDGIQCDIVSDICLSMAPTQRSDSVFSHSFNPILVSANSMLRLFHSLSKSRWFKRFLKPFQYFHPFIESLIQSFLPHSSARHWLASVDCERAKPDWDVEHTMAPQWRHSLSSSTAHSTQLSMRGCILCTDAFITIVTSNTDLSVGDLGEKFREISVKSMFSLYIFKRIHWRELGIWNKYSLKAFPAMISS